MTGVDRWAAIRAVALAAVSLAVLVNATAWERSAPRLFPREPAAPGLTIELATERKGHQVPVDEAGPLRPGQYLHVSGTAPTRCHLFVLTVARAGLPRALLKNEPGQPGAAVGPGPYQVKASYDVSESSGPLRFWAVCGPAELTYDAVLDAALRAHMDAGGGEDGVRGAKALEGLPEKTLTATRVVERSY